MEATDRFGAVLTLRLVRQGDSATTGSVLNKPLLTMIPTSRGGLTSSILYPQDGDRDSKQEGLGTPSLAHMTTAETMSDTTADNYPGKNTRPPSGRSVRTSGASARISGGEQSRGGYSSSSRIAPSRTVGAGTGSAARNEGNMHNVPPGLKLLGGLTDEAGGDVLEVRSSVVMFRNARC